MIQPIDMNLRLIICLSKETIVVQQAGDFMNDQVYTARVREMQRKLYRISHAILLRDDDCADAIQEAVFKGWMKKGALRDEALFETWMVRILINECRSLLRKRKNDPVEYSDKIDSGYREDAVEDIHLRQALTSLPEKYRMPLLLHHLEGYRLDEISQMLDVPQGLVKSRLHQARKQMRQLLSAGD